MSTPSYIILSDSEDESEYSSTPLGTPVSPFFPDPYYADMETQHPPTEMEEGDAEDTTDDTIPETPPFFYRMSFFGARTVTMARKTVGLPPRGLLYSTPTPATTTPPTGAFLHTPTTATPTATATTTAPRQRVDASWRGWLSDTLTSWENQEGLPRTFEVGESSTALPRAPVPQDPTTALLVARMVRQEQAYSTLRADLERSETQIGEAIHGHLGEVWADAHLTNLAMGTLYSQQTETRHEIARLRYRLEESERYAAELAGRLSILEGQLGHATRYTQGASSSRRPGHYHI